MPYVKPEEVLSPRDKVGGVLEVIHNPGPGGMAVARILWEEDEVVAVRWNGNDEQPLGHPVVRRHPTWFVIDQYAARAIEDAAREKEAESPTSLAAGYREMARDKDREREAQEWADGLIQEPSRD